MNARVFITEQIGDYELVHGESVILFSVPAIGALVYSKADQQYAIQQFSSLTKITREQAKHC